MSNIVKTNTYKKIGEINATDYTSEWFKANSPFIYITLELQNSGETETNNRHIPFEAEKETIAWLFGKPDPKNKIFKNGLRNDNIAVNFSNIFKPLAKLLQETYPEFEGEFKRAHLHRIRAEEKIKKRIDKGYHAENTYHIHLCMYTTPKCYTIVDGEMFRMEIGGVYELNNLKPCSITNDGDQSRVHLIVDWGPQNDTYWSKSSE